LGYWLRPRWYQNTWLHRIIPGFMCQGGDFNYANGMMGESIYGQYFRDERFCYKHSKRGVLSMAHTGQRNTCNSHFFITFAPAPWLDGKHVVFGHVVEGMEVLDKIEKCGTEGGRPLKKVWIYSCGEEDHVFLRSEVLKERLDPAAPIEGAAAAADAVLEGLPAAPAVSRPDPYPHIAEISPVPQEVWRRAKARENNML